MNQRKNVASCVFSLECNHPITLPIALNCDFVIRARFACSKKNRFVYKRFDVFLRDSLCGISPTVFIHAHFEALLQPAGATLVSVNLVHGAVAFAVGCPTRVVSWSADTPLEKSTAAIACVDPVVLTRRAISADFTWNVQKSSGRKICEEEKQTKKLIYRVLKVKVRLVYCGQHYISYQSYPTRSMFGNQGWSPCSCAVIFAPSETARLGSCTALYTICPHIIINDRKAVQRLVVGAAVPTSSPFLKAANNSTTACDSWRDRSLCERWQSSLLIRITKWFGINQIGATSEGYLNWNVVDFIRIQTLFIFLVRWQIRGT